MALILVVEDSSFQRKIIIKILEKAGNKTLFAENGIKGMEVLETHQPDCIFCDLLMPEMDGFGFIEALNEKKISIPLISISLLFFKNCINVPSPQPTSKTLVFFSIKFEII